MSKKLFLVGCLFFCIVSFLASQEKLNSFSNELIPIVQFYQRQNIIGKNGNLLENVLLKQTINAFSQKKNETTTVLLFAKNPKKCLVYYIDKTGVPTAYLQRGQDTWIYRTNLRTPLKVTTSQNILGEANVGDILGLNLLDDFVLLNIEKNEKENLFYFERSVSNYPYPSIIVSLNPKTEKINSIFYQGLGKKTIRVADLSNYTIINKIHEVPVWNLRNLYMNIDLKTTITYTDIRQIEIPDSFFQPDGNSLKQFLQWAKSFL